MYSHYARMIASGGRRTMPCPFYDQGLLLNPEGDVYYCERSRVIGNVLREDPQEIYFRLENLRHRKSLAETECPGCTSPCQVPMGALKQVTPYASFLARTVTERWRAAAEPPRERSPGAAPVRRRES
jgi:hypothetical protein